MQEKCRVPPLDADSADIKAALARLQREWTLASKTSLSLLTTDTVKSVIYRERSACITMVVSPLVTLMEDQVSDIPSFLKAAALNHKINGQTTELSKELRVPGGGLLVEELDLHPEHLLLQDYTELGC